MELDSSLPLWALLGRGTAIYFAVMVTTRLLPKREIGSNSPVDLLALVIAGGLVADAMSVGSERPMDFLLLLVVVLVWGWVLNWLQYRIPLLERLLCEPPVVIVRNGTILHRGMRKELITEEELLGAIRRAGLDDVESVARATVESTGEISVVPKK